MNTSKIYTLIGSLVFSIVTAYGSGNKDSLYKVLKIKTRADFYVINALRNDSLFKIISKKVPLAKHSDLKRLKKGKSYYFDFGDPEHSTPNAEIMPLTGNASHLHTEYSRFFKDGRLRIKFKKRFHDRIYMTRNLVGLYYSR